LEHRNPKLFFEYRYRDASNYKVEGRILLTGNLTKQEQAAIQGKMESGQFFVAEQVGIPPLFEKLFEFGGGPTAEDHAWHEFDSFQETAVNVNDVEKNATVNARAFLDAFNLVQDWKPELSSNFR
jgi:hypothetical protein